MHLIFGFQMFCPKADVVLKSLRQNLNLENLKLEILAPSHVLRLKQQLLKWLLKFALMTAQ